MDIDTTVSVVVSIDYWKSGPDDFADMFQSIIRGTLPTTANRITVTPVKD